MKRACLLIVVCLGLGWASAGTYSGGAGTAEDPYKISTVGDWLELMAASGDWGQHFLLTSDLNLVGVPLTPIALDTDSTDGNGFQGTPFSGVFDGGGHVLRNAVMNRPAEDFVGLFGTVTTDGQIRNLGVENATITGRRNVGGLAAILDFAGITSCYATGSITGIDSVGGLVGVNGKGSISSCWATATVSGEMSVGGLVGENGIDEEDASSITLCYATGSATGLYHSVGGLVGQNTGYITSCYATGAASVDQAAGGLVGYNSNGKVVDCYSTGSPTGGFDTGGLCGYNYDSGMYLDTGNFWDTDSSGIATSAMGTGKTTTQMKTLATFISAYWDFVGEVNIGTEDVWRMCGDGVDYPRLSWEVSRKGDFTCPDGVWMEDLLYMAERWMERFDPEMTGAADATGDDRVNLEDFAILSAYWLTGIPLSKDIVSAFDADPEGWLVVGFQGGYVLPITGGTTPNWSATGGLIGGGISTEDWYAETFFSAPTKFLGNQSAAFGTNLQFDIYISYTDNAAYPAVILHGAVKNLYYTILPTPVEVWTHRSIPLVGAGWKVNGRFGSDATDADMLEVLSDLRGLYINAEWKSGPDLTYLDNVFLSGAKPI